MFRWVAKQYRLITDEHEWFRRSVSGHDFRLLKPGLAARQLGVPAVGLGACCWFGVGAGAGDEFGGPGGEGVAGDGWRADAVRAEEPGSVLAGCPRRSRTTAAGAPAGHAVRPAGSCCGLAGPGR